MPFMYRWSYPLLSCSPGRVALGRLPMGDQGQDWTSRILYVQTVTYHKPPFLLQMASLPPGDQAGIAAAKKKGVYKGRKPSVPVAKAREMREAGQGPTAIAKALGISRMSVHRALTGA